MGQKGFLLLLLLAASCLLLSSAVAAVPSSAEILKPFKDDPSVDSVHHLLSPQGKLKAGTGEKLADEEEVLIEGRMDLETTDYGGTGANDHHDPPAQV